jgi:hypothetical protein
MLCKRETVGAKFTAKQRRQRKCRNVLRSPRDSATTAGEFRKASSHFSHTRQERSAFERKQFEQKLEFEAKMSGKRKRNRQTRVAAVTKFSLYGAERKE